MFGNRYLDLNHNTTPSMHPRSSTVPSSR